MQVCTDWRIRKGVIIDMDNNKEDNTDQNSEPRKAPKILRKRVINEADPRGGSRALPLTVLFIFFLAVFLVYLYTQGFFDKGIVPTPPPAARSARKPPELGVLKDAAQINAQGNKKIEEAAKLVKSGECITAVPILKEVLADDPARADVKRALAGCLNMLGTSRYRDGSFAQAVEYFNEAVSYAPEPVIVKNLANAKARFKDYAGAAAALESLSEKDRDKAMLLEVYYAIVVESSNSGDFARAAEFARKGQTLDPNDARFKNLPVKPDNDGAIKTDNRQGKGAVDRSEAGMTRVDGGHFTVSYDGGENAVTGHVISILLEEAYLKVGAETGFYPTETVEALLYTKERFRDITGVPSWAGGVYDGRIKIPAGGISEKTDLLERVIIHEYTHSVVNHLSGGRAPVWLNEGLAQMQEGKKSSAFAVQLKRVAKSGKVNLKRLEGSFLAYDAEQAQMAYLLGLSATEYLVDEYSLSAVKTIFDNLKNGKTIDEAFRAGTMMSYDDFQKSWLQHIAR